ncbi:transcription repressor OFP7-like [Phragmites australis]|uniref:transcription repressor OFP7-like n=1 Tax=Phragmites australis TaxID=29695 RepID=UPI002D794DC4|nr:transcription repressor OFP7-like [Phragmites australis]
MAKRLFHSCRSPSAASAVTPTTTLLAPVHPPVVPAPAGAACCPRRLARRRPQPAAACGARGCAVDYVADDLPAARGTPAYRWLKSSRWHVIEAANASAYATDGGDVTPRLKIDERRRVRRSRRRRRLHRRAAVPASWSSGDSGWFSSDDEEPYAYSRNGDGGGAGPESTLVTTSTTTESSSTGASGNSAGAAMEDEAAMAGSFAVVKRSEDPRADFRRSMAEMVVGRGIYDADGLERLLRCFLALNDRRHRRDIVAAFGDVWETVFSNPPSHSHGAVSSHPPSCKATVLSHP